MSKQIIKAGKSNLQVQDRDDTETFNFWVRDELETLIGQDQDVFRDLDTLDHTRITHAIFD